MRFSALRKVTFIRLRICVMKLEEIIATGRAHCDEGFTIGILGLVFAALGVISGAMNIILVTESISVAAFNSYLSSSCSCLDVLDSGRIAKGI